VDRCDKKKCAQKIMPTVKKQASLQGALAALEANQEHPKAAFFFQFCCEGFSVNLVASGEEKNPTP